MANLFRFLGRYAVLIALFLGVGVACLAAFYFWGGGKPALTEPVSAASDDGMAAPKTAIVFIPHPSTFEAVREDFHFTFRFQNRGNSAITIREIKPSCQCTMVEPSKRTYQPGEEGDILITIDMRRHPRGAKGFSITVKYQDEQGRNEEARTTFIVNHKPDIVVSPNPVHIQLTPGEHRMAQVVVMDYHARAIPLDDPHVLSARIKAVTVERPTVYLPGWRHAFEVSASCGSAAPLWTVNDIMVMSPVGEDPMIHEVPAVIPPLVAATQATTPSAEPPSPGEATLPAPTAEQVQAADRVFAAPIQPHPLATLIGVATSLVLLRDVAVDTFDTSGEEEEPSEEADKDADSTE